MTEDRSYIISEEETRRLLEMAQKGDFRAREQLAAAHQRLIGSIVRRFLISGREREDLYQVGCIGLLKAIDRFDPAHGVCFSTYAVPLIMGEIRRFLRDDSALSVSRGLKELYLLMERKRRELTAEWGEEPELWQLAEACGSTPEQIIAAREAARNLAVQEARRRGAMGARSVTVETDQQSGVDRYGTAIDLGTTVTAKVSGRMGVQANANCHFPGNAGR